MTDPTKRNARRAPGGFDETGQQANTSDTAELRNAQTIDGDRRYTKHAHPLSSTWPRSKAADPLDELEQTWGKP
jgi:hypothetical protein